MDNYEILTKWQNALAETYRQLIQQFVDIVPQLLVATALVLVGWIAGTIAARGVRSLLAMAASLHDKWVPPSAPRRQVLSQSQIAAGGRIIFWLVMLFFIAASASILGATLFSRLMADTIAYLPKLLTGLIIMLAGYWLSSLLKSIATAAAVSAGMIESRLIGVAVQVGILFTAVVIGAQQLGIDIQFLTQLLTVVLGVLLAGFSLAFGLGARHLVANIIGAQQARRHCRVGDTVTLARTRGVVVDITATAVILDSGDGRVAIPATKFQQYILVISEGEARKI